MTGIIYLIEKGGNLVEMTEQQYESEDVLQRHLADYPNLLAGHQIDAVRPRKWIFISREVGVPGEEAGSDRWSLDHLFLDQDGIPTLVELKRSTDTRSRREVVAEMLDYAANAVLYWPVEKLQAGFEKNCEMQGIDPLEELLAFLETENPGAAAEYWETVRTNLRAGKIRMIFMADFIQPELKRIVEFLNSQMTPAEVLAIQIPQYIGGGQKVMVPTVLGLTKPPPATSRVAKRWDEASFFSNLESLEPDAVDPVKKIYQWVKERKLSIQWGMSSGGSFSPSFKQKDTEVRLLIVQASLSLKDLVRVFFLMGRLRHVPPFTERARSLELSERFKKIPGLIWDASILDDEIDRSVSFPVALLKDEPAMKTFLATLDWIIQEIRSSSCSTPGLRPYPNEITGGSDMTVLDAGMLSRAQGCLLGQLAGDSLGGLVEFQSPESIRRAYPNGVRELANGGIGTPLPVNRLTTPRWHCFWRACWLNAVPTIPTTRGRLMYIGCNPVRLTAVLQPLKPCAGAQTRIVRPMVP